MFAKTDLGYTRGQLLKGAAASSLAVMLGSGAREALAAGGEQGTAAAAGFKGKNVVMFITDQERAIQHFPKGWAEKNLPGLMQLKRNGLAFENAFTNSCMCSPARASLLTGYMPSQHGVRHTLEADMPAAQYPQVELSTELKNIASVMASAGYNVIWKGKFHLTKANVDGNGTEVWSPNDVGKYGFERWDPKDAGANQDLDEGGGDLAANPQVPYTGGDNDDRYMNQAGDVALGQEGALAYLNSVAATQQPFFMVISLVNPHDVLFYPKQFGQSGYENVAGSTDGDIDLPGTVDEDLSTKPQAQAAFRKLFNLSGALKTRAQKRSYINFYGNLMKEADAYLVKTLDALQAQGLMDDTLIIRTSDHGEMGMSHGTQRQKCFNVYEESIRIPLVYSNPKLFPAPRTSDALVSHVDFLPTLASLFGAPSSARADWEGVDYSKLIVSAKAKPPQDYVMFTYDDYQAGQTGPIYVPEPNHITCIREVRWKLARYSDPGGVHKSQWEMYDLRNDPVEARNLADPGHHRTATQEREYKRLKTKLARVEKSRLGPLPGTRLQIGLSAATKEKSKDGNKITDRGTAGGVPVGSARITLDWTLDPASRTATVKITLSAGSGLIRAVGKTSFVTSGNDITFTGTVDITSGTGDFRGLKGKGLAFKDVNTLDGQNGQVTIDGTAVYA